MKINFEEIKKVFGFDLRNEKLVIGTTARNNMIFTWIIEAIENEYDVMEVIYDSNEEKSFKIIYHSINGTEFNKEKPFQTWKSLDTKLYDLAWLDPSYKEFLFTLTKKEFINSNNFRFNLTRAKNNYLLLLKNEIVKEILEYWKEMIIDEKNGIKKTKDHILSRIAISLYLNFKEILTKKDLEVAKLTFYENKILKNNNIKTLIELLKPTIQKFIIEEQNIEESKEHKSLLKEKELAFTTTIKDLLWNIKRAKIMVPVFQRDYIWKEKNVSELLNSIINDIPIGSLLLAETNKKFNNKNLIIQGIVLEEINDDNYLMVLDGQQRITSIIASMFGDKILHYLNRSNKSAYKIAREKMNKILTNIYIAKNEDNKERFWVKSELSQFNKKLIIEENQIKNNLEKVKKLLSNKPLSIVKVDVRQTEKLIEIFEKINIGSTKLTNIDLMHAAFVSNSKNQSDPFNLLEEIKNINEDPKIKSYDLSQDQIINMWKVLYDFNAINKKELSKFDYKKKTLLDIALDSDKSQEWISLTAKVKEEIIGVMEWLHSNFGFNNKRTIPNDAFLNVGMLLKLQNYKNAKDAIKLIIYHTIEGNYSAGTANQIMKDLNDIFYENYPPSLFDEHIKEDLQRAMEKIRYTSKSGYYKLIIGHMSLKEPLSLVDGKTKVRAKNEKYKDADKDEHHFLPKKNKEFEIFKNDVKDKISNIFIISEEENRKEIRARSPFDYLLQKAQNMSDYELDNLAKSHYLNIEDIKKIIDNRDNPKEEYIEKLWKNRETNLFNTFYKKWFTN